MNKVEQFFTSLLDKTSPPKPIEIDSRMIDDFLSFYRQRAHEISRHLAYEHDLKGSQKVNDSVIVKFDVRTYINTIDRYFKSKNLYPSYKQKEYYQLLFNILIPEEQISDLIPLDIRKKLFSGMIDATVLQGKINKKLFIKYLWEFVTALETPINGEYPEKILELFKESLAEQDRGKEHEPTGTEPVEVFQKLDVLAEVLAKNRIKSQRDMRRLLRRSNTFGLFFKLLLLLFLVITLYQSLPYISHSLGTSTDGFKMYIQILVLGGSIWVLLLVYTVSSFIHAATRKKTLFRAISGIIKVLYIKPDVLKVFFGNKYSVDYRKIH